MAVRLKADGLEGQKIDKWYVTDGLHAIGPVRLDLLAKGIELGRVPLDTFVRNESWKVWRPITDFTEGEASAGADSVLRPFEDDDDLDDGRPTMTPEEPASMDLAPAERAMGAPGTLPSDEVATLTGPPASEEPFVAEPSVEVLHESELITLSHDSKDLLGSDRLTLASYIDDEETNIATTRPFGPPIVIDAPVAPPRPSTKAPPPPSAVVRVQRESGPPPVAIAPPASSPPPGGSASAFPRRAPTASPAPSASPRTPRPISVPPRPLSVPPIHDAASSALRAGPTSSQSQPPGAVRPETPSPVSSDGPRSSAPAPVAGGELSVPGWTPEMELTAAKDLSEGLLLLLHAVVQRTPADLALVHKMSDEGATVVCAHGPNAPDLLGTRVRLLDPAIVAAAGGSLVIAEPAPGPAGDATLQRLAKLGRQVEGAVMIPLRPRGRLMGILEMGKAERFHLRSIIRAEDLARAFVAKAESSSWSV